MKDRKYLSHDMPPPFPVVQLSSVGSPGLAWLVHLIEPSNQASSVSWSAQWPMTDLSEESDRRP